MSDVLLGGSVVEKEGSSRDSWVDPMVSPTELAVQFDRETQSLRLIQKGAGPRSRGCVVLLVIAMVVWVVSAALFLLTRHFGALVSGMALVPMFLFALLFTYDRQIEIDTKSKRIVRRVRGTYLPWAWDSSTPINDEARFMVQTIKGHDTPSSYVLSFVPHPDGWFSLWNPIPIGATGDPDKGKRALERMAHGLNRFLDAVRKGEPNLERLAQPAPPGPFKP